VIREKTGPNMCFKPVMTMICELSCHLKGWANYFKFGYPRMAFRQINWYAEQRIEQHLRRRSQRSYRPPAGTSFYEHLGKLGFERL